MSKHPVRQRSGRQYDSTRQQGMRKQLERILAAPELSPDVYEIAAKSLGREG